MTYNNTATYTSDWIENTGVMPFGINSDTVLQVKYVDGHVTENVCDFDDADLWTLIDNSADIDMYCYVYKGMSQDAIDDKADHMYNLSKEE